MKTFFAISEGEPRNLQRIREGISMALIYTTLASDTFNRANENPLNPAVWRADPDPLAPPPIAPLQIIDDQAVSTELSEGIAIYHGINWPDDQWVQVQVNACNGDGTGDGAAILLVARRQNDHNAYAFEVNGPLGPSCNVIVFSEWTASPTDPTIIGTTFFTGDAEGDGINIRLYAGDSIRLELYGNTIAAYTIHDGVKTQILAPTAATPQLPFGQVAVDLFDESSLEDTAVSNFSGGGIISTDSSSGSHISLPFTLRTTAAVTLFACLQAAISAQTLTTDVATISALQLLRHQMFTTYKILRRQDVANQKEKLDAAVADAQTEIDSLYAIVSAMPAPIPPTDDVRTLPNIVAVVANGVQTIANCVVDE
jgi:hypothetical protein